MRREWLSPLERLAASEMVILGRHRAGTGDVYRCAHSYDPQGLLRYRQRVFGSDLQKAVLGIWKL